MCGIAGIWNFNGAPVSEETIIRFTDSLKHRGPDGRGIWHNKNRNLAFGHRRLAIIDLSHEADQPLHYHDNRYHIVFNGEIYNFLEIRNDLRSKGYTFTTDSDTEVIMASYMEWKEEMLNRFNGMWALIIYDSLMEECFIARDRFGIKPFQYSLSSTQFAFASELKSFLSLDGFELSINRQAAACFLKTGFGVEGSSYSMFEGVRKLEAGYCGWIKEGKLSLKQWWRTSDHLVDVPERKEEQAEQFRALFYDSVQLRMRSDVSIGSSLSGGFDSSAVVCALAEIGKSHTGIRHPENWQQTFVATFPGKSNDERPQAEEVIRYSGVNGHFFEVKEEEALQMLDQVLFDFDDVYVGIPVAPWLIYRELRRNNIVVSLDGHGADELMGAYMTAAGAFLSNAPGLIEEPGFNHDLLRQTYSYLNQPTGFKSNISMLYRHHPDFEFFRNTFRLAKQVKDRYFTNYSSGLMTPEAVKIDTNIFRREPVNYPFDETTSQLYQMFHEDVLPTILRNFDRMSMAHGIEIRMPFMDWRLVSYVFSLQGKDKISGGYTKRIAREAMRGRMPESIRDSKVKIGFNAPMPEWFASSLQPWIHQLLDHITSSEMVDIPALKKEIERNTRTGNWNWSNTGQVWKYLHYLWFENNFIKK